MSPSNAECDRICRGERAVVPCCSLDRAELRTLLRAVRRAIWASFMVPPTMPVDALTAGLQGLGAAQTKEQLVDALWDLRDSAYDEPQVQVCVPCDLIR